MPALVKRRVGSSWGTQGLDLQKVCPSRSKNEMKEERTLVMGHVGWVANCVFSSAELMVKALFPFSNKIMAARVIENMQYRKQYNGQPVVSVIVNKAH